MAKGKKESKREKEKESQPFDLAAIEKAARRATKGNWCFSSATGAHVIVGTIHEQGPGRVSLEKGGFFLLEINPDDYDLFGDGQGLDGETQAFRDAEFIGMTGPKVVLAMAQEIRALRAALKS